jgi:DNA polymerase-3 subunit alpha
VSDQFVHLHVHSEFSILDGAARIKDMFEEAVRLGMPAVAITDHGNMHGVYEFFKAAKKHDVTPVLGIEAYLAPHSRYDKKPVRWGDQSQKSDDISGAGKYTHATLWAQNNVGLHNLFRLTSRASLEGQYGKPRMDADLIAEHAEGIMATTGCPSGEVQTRLRLGQFDEALKAAATFQDIFGKENYFLEVMDHGIEIERRVRGGLTEIAQRLDIPPVVTNDSHYTRPDQRESHDALLCVQTQANISDTNRFRFDGDGYYLRSAEEMYAQDNSELWIAGCRNTLMIAERVDTTGMFTEHDLMPNFPVPQGETESSWFTKEVWEGMDRRYKSGIPDDRRAQAEYEIGIIIQMGFPAYFLVVADFINWAKNNGIPVGPGRGSAAGSIVAYALGITDLDPITHGLIFERFLNPERVAKPDIDIDFDERGRSDVIRYVTEKYGSDRVAQIVTFGTIKAKAAVKDAARVLGHPFAVGDKITKAFPPAVMGKDIPLSAIFDDKHPRYNEAAELRTLTQTDPLVANVIEVAKGLEGLVRQTGVHAAGVIMSSEPLIDHVPIMMREQDQAVITQFDYPTCESIGLIKMDFLGLRNLTIIDDALRNLQASAEQDPSAYPVTTWADLLALPLDDPKTYELLARGETLGVFQLDGGPLRDLLRLMKPDNFEDVSAALALYRPGPMGAGSHTNYALRKNKQQEITPIHPELAEPLDEILGPTYGLIVYQEQVQRAAVKLAGYSLGQADNLRKAMGKKVRAVLDKEFITFEKGMQDNGYSPEAIKTLWDILVPFADYAFNKAHTAAYGLIAYWTAYLKANHPAEYMSGLLTSVGDDKDKMAIYLSECRRMGLKVLAPDVNSSRLHFAPDGEGNIRFGLGAVRNVGAGAVDSIVRMRKDKGAYTSFSDFMTKVEQVVCNKRTVESMIKAGAFDTLGHSRMGLLSVHADVIDNYVDVKRKEAAGQFDLFGAALPVEAQAGFDKPIPEEEWDRKTLLSFEKEMLGLYVSSHPLAGAERILKSNSENSIAQVMDPETPDGFPITVAGMLTGVSRRLTKQGKQWASAVIEDLDSSTEVLFFPKTFEAFGEYLADDLTVAVKGRVNKRDSGSASIMVQDMRVLSFSEADLEKHPPVVLELVEHLVTAETCQQLSTLVQEHSGKNEIHVALSGGVYRLGPGRVNASIPFLSEVKAMAMVKGVR